MNNVEKLVEKAYSTYDDVTEWVRENQHIDDDEKIDEYINTMTPHEIVDAYLEWNGIIGFTNRIIEAVTAVYDKEV